jgi:hypothetical protein
MMLFASKALVYQDLLGFYRSEPLNLGKSRLERSSVVRIAVVGFNSHNPVGMTRAHQGKS